LKSRCCSVRSFTRAISGRWRGAKRSRHTTQPGLRARCPQASAG
jgi:hypothetical protein